MVKGEVTAKLTVTVCICNYSGVPAIPTIPESGALTVSRRVYITVAVLYGVVT